MAKTRNFTEGIIPMELTEKPIYNNAGFQIYMVSDDCYWLTNDSHTLSVYGNKEEICKIIPDFCA